MSPSPPTTVSPSPTLPSPVILFGYPASPFTQKIRHVLHLKQIPYTYVHVPSTFARRSELLHTFNLPYRRIPVLAIGGRDVYCDTALIVEALERFFPSGQGWGSVYPGGEKDGIDEGNGEMRGLARLWSLYVADRALFRVMTGFIPAAVWRGSFGRDREALIGHAIDGEKLERKRAEMAARLDGFLSILEPSVPNEGKTPWMLRTRTPGLLDVSVYTQLWWAREIAAGRFSQSISDDEVGADETKEWEGVERIFNGKRYPRVWAWYLRMQKYLGALPEVEELAEGIEEVVVGLQTAAPAMMEGEILFANAWKVGKGMEVDEECGLSVGCEVSVAPEDTGRNNPTIGTIIALSPEEVIIQPRQLDPPAAIEVRVHFPRMGFMVKPVKKMEAKL